MKKNDCFECRNGHIYGNTVCCECHKVRNISFDKYGNMVCSDFCARKEEKA